MSRFYGSSYLKDGFEKDSEAIVRCCRKVCHDRLMVTALEVWVEEKVEALFYPLQVEPKIAINYILRNLGETIYFYLKKAYFTKNSPNNCIQRKN